MFAIRNGVTIERQYQPSVLNPKSDAQVEARAKLKLISQVSAVLARYAAMPKDGLRSKRNMFQSVNYAAITYANSKADINMDDIKLTNGVLALPAIVGSNAAGTLTLALQKAEHDIERMVYVVVLRQADGAIRVIDSKVVSDAGASFTYETTMNIATTLPVEVYGYGIVINNEETRVRFNNMDVSAEYIASVMTSRTFYESGVSFTESVHIRVTVGQ